MNKPEQLVIGLKCRLCSKSRYREVTIDLHYRDVMLEKVKALKCSNCGQLFFTLEHHEIIRKRLAPSQSFQNSS